MGVCTRTLSNYLVKILDGFSLADTNFNTLTNGDDFRDFKRKVYFSKINYSLAFATCAWVCRIISACQMLKIQSCVELGSGNIGVAKHFLYGTQILGGLQDMAGEAMTQHVRVYVGG
jgi:hypothetical protein